MPEWSRPAPLTDSSPLGRHVSLGFGGRAAGLQQVLTCQPAGSEAREFSLAWHVFSRMPYVAQSPAVLATLNVSSAHHVMT
jgi:hypothetical protein